MLATLIIWLYTLLVLAGWGLGGTALLRRLLPISGAPAFSLPGLALGGLVAVTTTASLLSLFAPTAVLTSLVLTVGALAGLYFQRRAWAWHMPHLKLHPLAALLAAVTLLGVLNAATLPPSHPDTGIYHAQAVRWIESYPAVPGLGNFYTRLAYNSSWFVTSAAFSLSFLGLRSFHLTTSILFLIGTLYFLEGVHDLLRAQAGLAAILKTAFFPLATYLLAGDISSPAPDLAAALLVWICFVLYLESASSQPGEAAWMDVLLAVLAALAVTVKLSALPLLLLPALRLLRQTRRQALCMAGLAALVLLPWLARNLILSGYLVFPALEVDLLDLDWRVPPETVRSERVGIASFARLPRLPRSEVEAMPLAVWSRLWFNNLTANRQMGFLAALFSPALAVVSLLAGWATRRRDRTVWENALRVLPAWVIAWLGLLFWFFSAPAVRFGYGYLVAAPLLSALPVLSVALRLPGQGRRWIGVLAALALILYQAAFLAQSLDAATLPVRLALPADYTNLPTGPCQSEHLSATCATQWQECGYATFPCAPGLNPTTVLRGNDWRSGFRSLDLSP